MHKEKKNLGMSLWHRIVDQSGPTTARVWSAASSKCYIGCCPSMLAHIPQHFQLEWLYHWYHCLMEAAKVRSVACWAGRLQEQPHVFAALETRRNRLMCKPAHALGRLASLPAARCLAQAKQRAGFCVAVVKPAVQLHLWLDTRVGGCVMLLPACKPGSTQLIVQGLGLQGYEADRALGPGSPHGAARRNCAARTLDVGR